MSSDKKVKESVRLSAEEEEEDEALLSDEQMRDPESAPQRSKLRKKGFSKVGRAPSVCSTARGSAISVRGIRMRRAAQLACLRRGPSTPVPSWKLVEDAFIDCTSTEILAREHDDHHHDHLSSQPLIGTFSARRLAARVWELQTIPTCRGGAPRSRGSYLYKHSKSLATAKPSVLYSQTQSSASSRAKQRWPKPSTTASKVETAGRVATSANLTFDGTETTWKEIAQGPGTSIEYMKVLNHVKSLEEHHKSSISLVDHLHRELDQSLLQMQELMKNEKKYRREVEAVTDRLVKERALWKERQQVSIEMAVQAIKEELYGERKSRNRLESRYRRMVKEYHELEEALGKAVHDLERETKARELMEDVCDELAREIGDDKARVEEMKRESVKVREEVEEERKMLQMAELWREERVQMKLMEAKLELEEKNTALDRLRGELENFLRAKRGANTRNEADHNMGFDDARQDWHSTKAVPTEVLRFKEIGGLPGQNSINSRHFAGSQLTEKPTRFDGDDGSSLNEDRPQVVRHSKNVPVKQKVQHNYQQKAPEGWEGKPTNRRMSIARKSKHHRGLRSSHLKEGSRWGDHHFVEMQKNQRIRDDEYRRGDMRAWGAGLLASPEDRQEEQMYSWPSENEASQDGSLCSQRPFAEETNNKESSGTNAVWLRQLTESSRDLPTAASVFAPMQQQLYAKSSPPREWNRFWPSPDRRSAHESKGKGSSRLFNGKGDHSLKAKLLEAKIEGQHARMRAGMG